MKIQTVRFILIYTLALILSSCIENTFGDYGTGEGGERTTVMLRIKTPGNFNQATRSLTATDESSIDNVYVIGFKESSSSVLTLDYVVKGTNLAASADGNITFSTEIPQSINGQRYRLVVIANAKDEIERVFGDDLQSYTGNGEYLAVQKLLKRTIASKMFSGTGERIPMWGMTGSMAIGVNPTIAPIKMMRSIARVDIGVGVASQGGQIDAPWIWNGKNTAGEDIPFKISKVYVVRANKGVSIMPDLGNLASDMTLPTAPTLVPEDTKFEIAEFGAFEYDDISGNGLYSTQSIYIPEAAVVTPTESGNAHVNRVALVVAGSYGGGAESFYRINFSDGNGLMNILRNHLYRFSIKSVSGAGYGSVEEAYNSTAMNMVAEVLMWNESEIDNIEFDGQNYFGIEKREVTFTPMGGETITYKVRSNVSDWKVNAGAANVLDASDPAKRTYTNAALGFEYTIADGIEPNTYTFTVKSTKHNIKTTPARQEELLEISAKRLKLPFKTIQESADMFIDRQSSYRFYPEGSTLGSEAVRIRVASLTQIEAAANSSWITVTKNITHADGVYAGTITAEIAPWQHINGTTDRVGVISITPNGRQPITSAVTQEAPYIQFNETSVILRELTTRVAGYDNEKILQIRTNLPVGYMELSHDLTNDPDRRFNVVGGMGAGAFSYPDSYYPRNASMTVEARINTGDNHVNGAAVTYTAKGTVASTFQWVSGATTFIIQPSTTTFNWKWDWAGYDSSKEYIIPWNVNTVSLEINSNRGAAYDLGHAWSGGQVNPTSASGNLGAPSLTPTTHPFTFTFPAKANMVANEQLGVWLKSNDALASPQEIGAEINRGKQEFSHNAATSYSLGWQSNSVSFNVTSNVEWKIDASGEAKIQRPSDRVWVTNLVHDWRKNVPHEVVAGNTNGTKTETITIGTLSMTVDNLNSSIVTLPGTVAFTNSSGGTGAPTLHSIAITRYTPQLSLVSHTIPNPILPIGGDFKVIVSTNIPGAGIIHHNDGTYPSPIFAPTNETVNPAGAAQNYVVDIHVQKNTGAERLIYFDMRTSSTAPLIDYKSWNIKQLGTSVKVSYDFQGYGIKTAIHDDAFKATGVPFNLPAAHPATSAEHAGLAFAGWTTEPNGAGTRFAAGALLLINEDTKYYADWRVKVNANPQGGSGLVAPTTVSLPKVSDTQWIINVGNVTKQYHNLLGWSLIPNAIKSTPLYSKASIVPININSVLGTGLNLYAVWSGVIPYITTIDGGNTLTLATGPENPVFFKWGSLVGMKANKSGGPTYYYPQQNNPGYSNFSSFPYTAGTTIIQNINAGKGDPCKIVNLTKQQIANNVSSGYRMPNQTELLEFQNVGLRKENLGTMSGMRGTADIVHTWPNTWLPIGWCITDGQLQYSSARAWGGDRFNLFGNELTMSWYVSAGAGIETYGFSVYCVRE